MPASIKDRLLLFLAYGNSAIWRVPVLQWHHGNSLIVFSSILAHLYYCTGSSVYQELLLLANCFPFLSMPLSSPSSIRSLALPIGFGVLNSPLIHSND